MSYADIDLAMVPAAPPSPKEPAGDFLAGSDFSDGAVPAGVKVDPERLLQRVLGRFHEGHSSCAKLALTTKNGCPTGVIRPGRFHRVTASVAC